MDAMERDGTPTGEWCPCRGCSPIEEVCVRKSAVWLSGVTAVSVVGIGVAFADTRVRTAPPAQPPTVAGPAQVDDDLPDRLEEKRRQNRAEALTWFSAGRRAASGAGRAMVG